MNPYYDLIDFLRDETIGKENSEGWSNLIEYINHFGIDSLTDSEKLYLKDAIKRINKLPYTRKQAVRYIKDLLESQDIKSNKIKRKNLFGNYTLIKFEKFNELDIILISINNNGTSYIEYENISVVEFFNSFEDLVNKIKGLVYDAS